MPVKIDLHVHTCYSYDSLVTREDLLFYARRCGLDGVAVTDHDRLDSAMKMARELPIPILPGMEVTSRDGHIVALAVQRPVPKGLSAEETVEKIHEYGGIAVACHPTAFFRGSLREHVSSKFDAVEVINSSAFPFRYCVKKSMQVASRLGLPKVAGSDAHSGPEVGCAYSLIESDADVASVLEAIRKGLCTPRGGPVPFWVRLNRELAGFRRSRARF